MTIDTGHNGARPVPVEITNVEALAGAVPHKGGLKRRKNQYRTIVLTTLQPVRLLWAQDLSREYVRIYVYGGVIALCESESQAQDPANAIAALPNPEGARIELEEWVRIDTTEQAWAVADSGALSQGTVMVTLIIVSRELDT